MHKKPHIRGFGTFLAKGRGKYSTSETVILIGWSIKSCNSSLYKEQAVLRQAQARIDKKCALSQD